MTTLNNKNQVLQKKKKKRALTDPEQLREDFEHYSMPWAVELLPDRLSVGPMVRNARDARFLAEWKRVTHFVSMVPESHRTEATQRWQTQERERLKKRAALEKQGGTISDDLKEGKPFWDPVQPYANHLAPPNVESDTIMLRCALPEGDESLSCRNTAAHAKWYVTQALRLSKTLCAHPNAHVYVHNADGKNEEALLAMTMWSIMERASCPGGSKEELGAWLRDHRHEQMLDSEEQRVLWEHIWPATAKQTTGLTSWLQQSKRP